MKTEERIEALKTYNTDLDEVPDAAVTERKFRIALKETIDRAEKYKWHSLALHPNILPENGSFVIGITPRGEIDFFNYHADDDGWEWELYNCPGTYYHDVLRWRYFDGNEY